MDRRPTPKANFNQEPTYERRLVVFYDFLGWQSHIDRAGTDPNRVGFLHRMLVRQPRLLSIKKHLEIRYSTFSDNVVITQDIGPKTPMLIQQLANFQLASALTGFLIRGGITIGDVVHDDEAVFGPRLNRAYHLESIVARLPRFVLLRREAVIGRSDCAAWGIKISDRPSGTSALERRAADAG